MHSFDLRIECDSRLVSMSNFLQSTQQRRTLSFFAPSIIHATHLVEAVSMKSNSSIFAIMVR